MLRNRIHTLVFFMLALSALAPVGVSADITTGLVGQWKLDEGTGTTVNDSSGNSNTGTAADITWVAGQLDGGMSFNGTTSYFNAGSGSTLDNLNTTGMTISFWMNASSYGEADRGHIIAKNSNNATGWYISKRSFGSRLEFYVPSLGGFTTFTQSNTLPSGEFGTWHHWTITWTGGTATSSVQFYKDGVLLNHGSGETAATVGSYTSDAAINFYVGGQDYYTYHGSLDEVRVYNRVLNQSDVTELYSYVPSNDVTPPVISSVASTTMATSATVTWTTDEAATSKLSYGTNPGSYTTSTTSSSLVASHSLTVTGLPNSTQYYFVVVSTDSSGNTATSSESSFRTTAPDSIGPVFSSIASTTAYSTATVTWTTDESATSKVAYSPVSGSYTLASSSSSMTTSHQIGLAALHDNTTYYYVTVSADEYGNYSTSTEKTFKTSVAPPYITNGAPYGVVSADTTATAISVRTSAKDATCKYGTTPNTAYASISNTFSTTGGRSHQSTVSGLSNGNTYTYYVRCSDSQGNANTTDYVIRFIVANAPVAGTTYYIDYDNGSDSNDGTSQSTPWKHVKGDASATGNAASVTLQPGDVLQFKAGVSYPNPINLSSSGSAGNPIIYKGTGWGSGKAILDGLAQYSDASKENAMSILGNYITIDGFEIRNRRNMGIVGTTVRSHITIKNNLIHDIGYLEDPLGASNYGKAIYLVSMDDALIEGNEIYNTNYTAIVLNGGNSNITIRNNVIHDGEVDGIGYGVDSGALVIDGNTIYGFDNNVNHGDGIQMLTFPDLLKVTNNTLYANGQEIFIEPYSAVKNASPAGDIYVFNNLIYCPTFTLATPCSNGIGTSAHNVVNALYIFNNTIVGYSSGWAGLAAGSRAELVSAIGTTSTYRLVDIKNNIIYNSKATGVGTSSSAAFEWDRDLFYHQNSSNYLSGNGANGVDLTQFQAANPGILENGLYGDPLFTASTTFDFTIQSGSPAREAGENLTEYFTTDRNGVARASSGAWDLGAFAYSASVPVVNRSSGSGRIGYMTWLVEPSPLFKVQSSVGTSTSVSTSTKPSIIKGTIPPTFSSLIETFIALGIIPPDKAEAARSAVFAPAPAFTRDLKVRDRGEDVRSLQKLLNRNGFTLSDEGPGSPGMETDLFGAATFAALKRYQSFHGIPSTGYFGPLTRASINGR